MTTHDPPHQSAAPQSLKPLPHGLTIRPATVDDLDAVIEIDRATPGAPHWSRSGYETIFDIPYQVNDQGPSPTLRRHAIVAVTDQNTAASNPPGASHILGFAVVKVVEFDSGSEMELESVVVAPHAQRQGIGSALMQAVLSHAESTAATLLTLEVRASNRSAIALYERFGLRRSGLRPSYYSHPHEDAALMELHFRR